MNERIKELAKSVQCERHWTEEDIEKFAQLLVKECAGTCMEMAAKCAGLPGDGALARDCADWIKKDFGVDE